jgi:hypothetical protein
MVGGCHIGRRRGYVGVVYRWRLVVMVLVISGLGLEVRGGYWWMHLVVFWRMVVVFVD